MSRVSPQLIVFSYHKSGTSLLLHVMTKVCDRLGLTLANRFGRVDELAPRRTSFCCRTRCCARRLNRPYRAHPHDPRSARHLGLRLSLSSAQRRGVVRQHRLRSDAADSLAAGRSLLRASARGVETRVSGTPERPLLSAQPAGAIHGGRLDFELEGYTGCTLAAMREWTLNGADALDVKLEDVSADFDGAMRRIFDHFGFDAEQSRAALEVARSEDVNRMDAADIASRPQIHSREISKWRSMLSPDQVARFEAAHGDLIRDLGYDLSGTAPMARCPMPRRRPFRSAGSRRCSCVCRSTWRRWSWRRPNWSGRRMLSRRRWGMPRERPGTRRR